VDTAALVNSYVQKYEHVNICKYVAAARTYRTERAISGNNGKKIEEENPIRTYSSAP